MKIANNSEELATAAGLDLFYLILPCFSLVQPNKYRNGTRITVAKNIGSSGGWDMSICTASTSTRFAEFEVEMDRAFNSLVEAVTEYLKNKYDNATIQEYKLLSQAVWEKAADLFFYWIHFSPLSRGTSAVGYMTFLASLLSINHIIEKSIPRDIQLDWEALLESYSSNFRTALVNMNLNMIYELSGISEWIDPIKIGRENASFRISELLITMKDVVTILNYENDNNSIFTP
jgi:hypothetical protein